MGLFEFMWDLGVSPMNAIMCTTALVLLFVLRATAKKEMQIIAKEQEIHMQTWTVYRSYVNDRNYVHGLYEEYTHAGHRISEAHELMQQDIKGLKIGHLYKPFDAKPTLVTRVLMLRIGGKH